MDVLSPKAIKTIKDASLPSDGEFQKLRKLFILELFHSTTYLLILLTNVLSDLLHKFHRKISFDCLVFSPYLFNGHEAFF